MDIRRKKKEKRIQLLGGLIGICVAVVSLFYFFHAEKAEAEKRMVEIVNYVKVQCSTYTHYNESSESKSLLRAIESARQMSTNIDMEIENGGQLVIGPTSGSFALLKCILKFFPYTWFNPARIQLYFLVLLPQLP